MRHEFVDRMLEQSKAGELRPPVSETLEYAGSPRAWNALATMKTSLEGSDEAQDEAGRP